LSEGLQYRVRTLEILGMDDAARNLLADRLPPGHILDMSLLKSLRDEDIEVRRNTHEHTVDITVDVRKRDCVHKNN